MRRGLVVAMLALLLAAGGCMGGPDPQESQRALRASRSQVIEEVRSVARLLQAAGQELSGATGSYESCGSAPTTSSRYHAGAQVDGHGSVGDRTRVAAEKLTAAGWKMEKSSYDGPQPYAILTKGELRLSVGSDGRQGGSGVDLGITGGCVRTPEDRPADYRTKDQIDLD